MATKLGQSMKREGIHRGESSNVWYGVSQERQLGKGGQACAHWSYMWTRKIEFPANALTNEWTARVAGHLNMNAP